MNFLIDMRCLWEQARREHPTDRAARQARLLVLQRPAVVREACCQMRWVEDGRSSHFEHEPVCALAA